MVKITEHKTRDINGNVITTREIEGAFVRIEHPDGTIEEYSDVNAHEWPWSLPDQPPEWRVFGIPIDQRWFTGTLKDSIVTFLADNGEIIMRLGSLNVSIAMAQGAGLSLMGNELPPDDTA